MKTARVVVTAAGIAADDPAWLVSEDPCEDGYTLTTPPGDVRLAADDAGVRAEPVAEPARVVVRRDP